MAVYEHPGAGGGGADGGAGPNNQGRGRFRSWQEWMMFAMGLIGLLSVLAIILSVSAIASNGSSGSSAGGVNASMNSAMSSSGGSNAGAAGAAAATTTPAKSEAVTLKIKSDTEKGKLGSDGKYHDAYLPANFTIHAGDSVTVTVYNYDDSPHSFTSPTLDPGDGINQTIKGGSETKPSKTVFTFTAPSTTGKYMWWCAMPCDPWAMSHIGYMRGYVTVSA